MALDMKCAQCGHANKYHKDVLYSSGREAIRCMFASVTLNRMMHYGCKCMTEVKTQDEIIWEAGKKYGLDLYLEDDKLKVM
jgi:hypothetical protein